MKRLAVALLLAVAVVAAAALFSGAEASASPLPKSLLRGASQQISGGLPAQGLIRRRRVVGHVHGLGLGAASVQTYNWTGYDAIGGVFSSVTASWTQPTIQPDDTSDSIASFWVGLDGDGSSTVEQIGTQAENHYGHVTYEAWYEMYPAYEIPIPTMTISPGDAMTATVTAATGGDFTLTLTDHTTGAHYATTQYSAAAQGYSAEVIAEAPTNGSTGNEYPLPQFGSVGFSSCAFNGQPISAFNWNQIDMVSGSGTTTLAAASPLGADGASFSVTSYPGVTPAPTLTSFTPTTGPVDTSVTLTGTRLSGASAVSLSGVAASFTVVSDTQIIAAVPSGASSGPFAVTTTGGTATSTASFNILIKSTLTLKLSGPKSGTIKLGKRVTAKGAVTPTSLAGSKVTLTVQRKRSGKWWAVTSMARTIRTNGAYSWKYKPAKKGAYRMKAAIAKTAAHTAATTKWRTFKVK